MLRLLVRKMGRLCSKKKITTGVVVKKSKTISVDFQQPVQNESLKIRLRVTRSIFSKTARETLLFNLLFFADRCKGKIVITSLL